MSVVALVCLGASTAWADGAALDHLEVADRGSRFFAADSLDLEHRMQLTTGVVTTYEHALRVFGTPEEGSRAALVADRLTLHPGASLVAMNRLRVAVDVPAVLQRGRDEALAGVVYPAPQAALGDVRLGADVKIVGLPRARVDGDADADGVVVAGGVWVWLPSGSRADYTSDGAARAGVRIGTAVRRGALLGAARIGFTYRRDDIDPFGGVALGSQLEGVAALGWHDGAITVGPEVHGVTILRDDPFGHRASPMEGILGAHAVLGRFALGAGVGTALSRGLGAPGIRALASIELVPASREQGDCGAHPCAPDGSGDRDGDGVLDRDDACPLVPGARRADPLTSGCADSDGDGVPDPIDACPFVPGVASTNPRENGCPSPGRGAEVVPPPAPPPGPPDRDNDGIGDADDACPDEPGEPSADPKTNGCPSVRRAGDKLALRDPIAFEAKRPVLSASGEASVDALAKWLARHPEIEHVRVEAHGEKLGPLTEELARAVVERLVAKGVARDRLEPRGMGGAPGVARRVELRVASGVQP